MSFGQSFSPILTAAQEGADWAWDALYRELAGPLLGYLRSRGAREPEDLVGEVFLQLARNIGTFKGTEANFRSWAFVVAHHRLIDERRANGRRPVQAMEDSSLERLGATGDAEEEAMAALSADRVRELLDRITPEQREVLLLRVLGGLTHDEVAEAMGKTTGAVKQLQRRGLAALKREIEREGVTL